MLCNREGCDGFAEAIGMRLQDEWGNREAAEREGHRGGRVTLEPSVGGTLSRNLQSSMP